MILFLFAFLAGLITALSPCSLPILPILLSAGTSQLRPLAIVTGLVLSFTFLILFLGTVVQSLGIPPEILRYIAIALIFLFGLVMLTGGYFRFLTPLVDLGSRLQNSGGLFLGASLGLVWAPCAGPILAAIVTLAATQTVTTTLFFLALFYSLGAALPMLLIMQGSRSILKAGPYTEWVRKIFGVLTLGIAIAMASGADLTFQQWASQYIPSQVLEDTTIVKKELSHLRQQMPLKNPELVGITGWINTPSLSLKQLHGKVVLIDFWTYSCINCIRTLPYLKEWDANYRDKGLVIIGVHTPEFAFEKSLSNVQEAVKRFQIPYPVALDSKYETWLAFNNSYWPAHYLFDQEGVMRDVHFGEGGYVETENAIRKLLGLSPLVKAEPKSATSLTQTAETYLGYARASHYGMQIEQNRTHNYQPKLELGSDQVLLRGMWRVGPESITAEGDDSILELNFQATRVHLVLEGPKQAVVEVLLDGQHKSQIVLDQPREYDILDLKGAYGRHQLTLRVPKGVSAFAFTYGSQ